MSYKKYKWTEKTENDLLKYISENKTIDDISKKLKINNETIIYKLKKISLTMIGKKTKEEIFNSLKFLTNKQIDKLIKRHENKNKSSGNLSELGIKKQIEKKDKNEQSVVNKNEYTNIINILGKINDKLIVIENLQLNILKKKKVSHSKSLNTEEIKSTNTNKKTSSRKKSSSSTKSNNKNKNNNSTSTDSSGDSTDDIMNMIKNRTHAINEARQKYMNEKKKS
jgi:hypothetical protein